MKQKKFIIATKDRTNTYLKLGFVDFHENLIFEDEICYGGGYYEVLEDQHRVNLWGLSSDYGTPSFYGNTKKPIGYEDYDFFYRFSKEDVKNEIKPLMIGTDERNKLVIKLW